MSSVIVPDSSLTEKMKIDVVTLFPEYVESVFSVGVVGRAVESGLLSINCINPRDFANNPARSVDDRPYGGGPGMVMSYEPVKAALLAAGTRSECDSGRKVIYFSPQGRVLDHNAVRDMASMRHLVLLCGRYEGIDERVINSLVDEEWSIGDYVMSGGELAAMVFIDTVSRQIPGVLGHQDSAAQDSFENGLLDCPHYTRPEQVDGMSIPKVLTSGNHQQIERWRRKQSIGRTFERRPELLERIKLSDDDKELLKEYLLERSKN